MSCEEEVFSSECDSDTEDEDLLDVGEEREFDSDNEQVNELPDSDDDEDFDVDNFPGKYCAKEFETNMMWETRDELVDWVKKLGKELMMCLVIRRSNVRHVSLTCEHFGKQRVMKKKCSSENEGGQEIVVDEVVDEDDDGTHSKKSGCTFELIGVPEKKKMFENGNRKWKLRIVSGVHNHTLRKSFNEHEVIGKLTEQEEVMVRNLGESYVTPTNICKQLQKSFPGNCTSKKQVSNYLQKIQFKNRGDLTITQWSFQFLKRNKYEVFPLRKNTTNEVEIFFFAHPESLKLLKRFPYVIIIDTTHKTNKYNMPLVEIIGVTCTHKTFNIAYAFIKREEIIHYFFIMKKLLILCQEVGVMPTTIITDREKVLIKAISMVFPNAKHLICWIHIKRNIETCCSPILKSEKAMTAFCDQCWGLFSSTTEESYKEKLEALMNSRQKGLVRYVENTWLIPYKENIVRAWTDHHLHFFTRTSNRVEGMPRVLKRIVDSNIGGFSRMVVRIHSAIESQISKIRASMEMSRMKMPTRYNEMKPHIRKIFCRLYYKISDRALMKLYRIYVELAKGKFKEECDDYWMRECQGLPCLHTVAKSMIEKKPISLSEIHQFWKQIDWERIVGSEADNVGDDHSMSIQEMRCHEFAQKLQRGEVKSSTVNHIGDTCTNLEYPDESGCRPTSIKEKRKSNDSTKWSVQRKSSRFEYAREDVDNFEKDKELKKDDLMGKQMKSQCKSQARKEQGEHDIAKPSPVLNDYEEPLGSQLLDEPIVHMGMDFGVNNIDYFWYPFIKDVRDVTGDGHCGYRSLCVVLGEDEGNYKKLRLTLASHLVANKTLYELALSILNPGKTFESYAVSVNYMLSPCPPRFWCDMPMVGLAFATVFQVALAFLSWDGPCLCLPMTTSQSRMEGDGLRVLAMGHIGNRNHFIPLWLTEGSPLPPTPYVWQQFKHSSVEGLDETFASRISMFREFRTLYGRSPYSMV